MGYDGGNMMYGFQPHGIPSAKKNRLSSAPGHSHQLLRDILEEISHSGTIHPFDNYLKKHLELCVRNTKSNTLIYVDLKAFSKAAQSPKRGRSIRWIDQVKSNNSAPMKSPEIGPTIKIVQRPASNGSLKGTDSAAVNFAYCLAESEINLLHSDILAMRYDNQQMEQLVHRTDLLLLPPLPTLEPLSRAHVLQLLRTSVPALHYLVSACGQVLGGGAPAAWQPDRSTAGDVLPLSPGAVYDGCQWQVLDAAYSPKANLHISSPLPRTKRHLPKPRRASASGLGSPEPGGARRPISSPEVFQMYGRDLVEDLESFFIDGDSDGSGPDGEADSGLSARPMVLSEFGLVGPSGAGGAGLPRGDRPHGLLFGGGGDGRPLTGGVDDGARGPFQERSSACSGPSTSSADFSHGPASAII